LFYFYLIFISFIQRIGEVSQGEALRSTVDLEHSRACDGQFREEYQPLKAVGKGAFGFVWNAIRRCDGQEVRNILIYAEAHLKHVKIFFFLSQGG